MLPADQRLGERLVSDGVLDTGLLAIALEVQCQETHRRPLGTLLIELGYVDGDIIYRALREQIADCLVHFPIAPGGVFRYQEKLIDPSSIDVDVIVEREVLDAIRRADEYVAHRIGTGPLRLSTYVSADILQPFINDHWDVIDAMLGGARTVDEIIAATRWTRSRVLDSLFQLQANGVIEFECSLVSTILA